MSVAENDIVAGVAVNPSDVSVRNPVTTNDAVEMNGGGGPLMSWRLYGVPAGLQTSGTLSAVWLAPQKVGPSKPPFPNSKVKLRVGLFTNVRKSRMLRLGVLIGAVAELIFTSLPPPVSEARMGSPVLESIVNV